MTDTVQSFGLGPRLDSRSYTANSWIYVIERDLIGLLERWPLAAGILFTITENPSTRAVARLRERHVLFTFGLMNDLNKLAATIVTQGVFVAFGAPTPQWRPTFDAPHEIMEQIGRTVFRWDKSEVPWLDDPERQLIFVHTLRSLARFILFHEVGHIVLGHGRTDRPARQAAAEMADGPDIGDPGRFDAGENQAKELAADTFAFEALINLLESEFSAPRDDFGKLIQERLLPDPGGRMRWAIITSYLVFRLLDRTPGTAKAAASSSHPPPKFRLKYLLAHAVARKMVGGSEEETGDEIRAAVLLADAIIAVALDRQPEPQWLSTASEEYDNLFNSLYQVVPRWSRMP